MACPGNTCCKQSVVSLLKACVLSLFHVHMLTLYPFLSSSGFSLSLQSLLLVSPFPSLVSFSLSLVSLSQSSLFLSISLFLPLVSLFFSEMMRMKQSLE